MGISQGPSTLPSLDICFFCDTSFLTNNAQRTRLFHVITSPLTMTKIWSPTNEKTRAHPDRGRLRHQAKQVHPGQRLHQSGLTSTAVLGQSCPLQVLEVEPSLAMNRPGTILAKMGGEVRKPLLHLRQAGLV